MTGSVQNRRRRGVVLTEDGLKRLTNARREREQDDRGGRRYTQEELEALTGLAARTLARVFDGTEPVDRRTLERAFEGLGLSLRRTDFVMGIDLEAPRSTATGLPAEFTSFLCRDREIREIAVVLSIGRLLTLTGPGGVGKTRTALRVARDEIPALRDGAWFFDLSTFAAPTTLTMEMATWLGLQDTANASGESALFRHLGEKNALLVLDNCEHVRDSAAVLCRDLLLRCPGLKILATSREPLRVPGEAVYQLASLDVPAADLALTVEQAREFDAVRFFEERSAAFVAGFALSEKALPAALEICRRLDGIPLALEFACAQLHSLGVTKVAEQLSRRLDLLHSPQRGVPDRQRTLAASLDWSYALLGDEERVLLRVLCVFVGGWSVDAATTIVRNLCLPVANVATILTHLVEKSFITKRIGDFGDRYTMLHITREYLLGLLQPDECASLLRAHAEYFAAFAGRVDPSGVPSSQLLAKQRLDSEDDDMRSALRWAIDEGNDVPLGARLAVSLTRWWIDCGRWAEGRRWFDLIRAGDSVVDERTRAHVVYGSASLATLQRDTDVAESDLMVALAGFEAGYDLEAFADALGMMTLFRRFKRRADSVRSFCTFRIFKDAVAAESVRTGLDPGITVPLDLDRRGAEALLRVSLHCYRAAGSRRGEGIAFQNLAVIALELDKDPVSATLLCSHALAISREIHREKSIAGAYLLLSEIAALLGDYRSAVRQAESALQIFLDFGHKPFAVEVLSRLGTYAALLGDLPAAASYFRDGLNTSLSFAYEWGILASIEGSARLAAQTGETRSAISLCGYAGKRRETWTSLETAQLDARRDALLDSLRSAADGATFDEAWARGTRLAERVAIEDAIRILDSCERR